MIVCASPFFNELDLLEIKCRELAGIVDLFVIVESTLTFTGIPKPLYFANNKARFAEFPLFVNCLRSRRRHGSARRRSMTPFAQPYNESTPTFASGATPTRCRGAR